MKKSTKKNLKKRTIPAILLPKEMAGIVMQGLKKIWKDYQWALALLALLYGIFLFYYNSTQATPAKIAALERQFAEHKADSERRISEIESDYNDVKLTLTELNAKMDISLQDLAIMKGYITGEAHHK